MIVFNFYVLAINLLSVYTRPPRYGPDYGFLIPGWLHITCAATAAVLCVLALGVLTKLRRRESQELDADLVPGELVETDLIPLWLVAVLSCVNFLLPLVRLLVV